MVPLFITIQKRPMEKNSYHYIEQHINALRTAERKLLFVPIVFIFIRIWGLITDVITFYITEPESMKLREQKISAFLVFMTVRKCARLDIIIIILHCVGDW